MEKTSKWWWIGGNYYNTSKSSPWLNSTLSELDSKTKEMLRVIDEVDDEADSFVKRAKLYHEKKPELIAMIEDLYRSHRSLAQKHDLLLIKTSSLNSNRHNSSTTCDGLCEETESEVDDGEEEDQTVVCGDDGETMKEELVRLREENRVYKEKREMMTWSSFANLVRVLLWCSSCFHFSWEIFLYSLLLRFCLLFSWNSIVRWLPFMYD